MPNPIFDNYNHAWYNSNWPEPLSKEERDFIRTKIIPNFELESFLIDDILKTIKTKKTNCDAHVIERKFEKSVLAWLSARSKNKDRKKFDDIHDDILTRSPELPFSDNEKEIMTSWRTSLMGRLSELGEVKWEIATIETEKIEKGTSYYTIPQ